MILDIKEARAIRKNLLRVYVEAYTNEEELLGVYEVAITAYPGDTPEKIGERIKFAIDGMQDTFDTALAITGVTIVVDDTPAVILPGFDKATGE